MDNKKNMTDALNNPKNKTEFADEINTEIDSSKNKNNNNVK